MAFADLILGAVCLPHQFIYITGDYFQLWKASLSSNLYFDTLQFILVQASLLSAALISAERLYAVNWPLKHRTLTTQTYRVVIFVVWTLVILVGMIIHFFVGLHAFYLQISFYLILILIECGCNMGIWRTFSTPKYRFTAAKQSFTKPTSDENAAACIYGRFTFLAAFNNFLFVNYGN